MHVINIKEVWDKNNVQLVDKAGELTSMGVMTYWMAINRAVQFNAEHFCGYGTGSKGKKELKRKQDSRQDSGDSKRKQHEVEDFFAKRRSEDRYHHRGFCGGNKQRRFLMPRLRE